MALAILDKYAADPDFREVLRTHGAAAIPPIAQADAGPQTIAFLQAKTRRSFRESLALSALFAAGENGQATIRTIKNDGLERVAQLSDSTIQFYQFLPLYDVIHLGNVMRRGYAPTSGEMTWALVDGCFVVADVLSLAAVQPEGAVAAEAIRSEVKGAVRQGVKSAGRELAEAGGESAGEAIVRQEAVKGIERAAAEGTSTVTERLARWWTVRSAGGVYQVLRRLPEALPRLSLAQITEMAGPLCTKAGIRLTDVAARPVLEGRRRGRPANPARARVEIPDGADAPGGRRRRRIPEDGGAFIEPQAAESREIRILLFSSVLVQREVAYRSHMADRLPRGRTGRVSMGRMGVRQSSEQKVGLSHTRLFLAARLLRIVQRPQLASGDGLRQRE